MWRYALFELSNSLSNLSLLLSVQFSINFADAIISDWSDRSQFYVDDARTYAEFSILRRPEGSCVVTHPFADGRITWQACEASDVLDTRGLKSVCRTSAFTSAGYFFAKCRTTNVKY